MNPYIGHDTQCYFHTFQGEGKAGIYNPEINAGLMIQFDVQKLPYFTQWKMTGERDYVMGLEPGNCHPDGRDRMRKEGQLTVLKPGEEVQYEVTIMMAAGKEQWKELQEA